MTAEELIELIKRAVVGYTHPYYERVTERAVFYEKLSSGNSHEELILRYKPRETEKQKKQRWNVYNEMTKEVTGSIKKVFQKVNKVDKKVDEHNMDESEEVEKENYFAAVSKYSKTPLRGFIESNFLRYNIKDPNAWHITEYKFNEEGEKEVYPLVVSSAQAVDFEVQKGETKYLIVKSSETVSISEKGQIKKYSVDQYYAYAPMLHIYVVEVKKELVSNTSIYPEEMEGQDIEEFTEKSKTYKVYITPRDTQKVPADRFGYIEDDETNGETYIGILEPAESAFKRLINDTSKFLVNKECHAFLKRIQYTRACKHQNETEGICRSGRMSISGNECQACGGTGIKTHRSEQDVIYIEWPEEGEQVLGLRDIVAYVEEPEHTLEFLRKEIDADKEDIYYAVYGFDVREMPTQQNVTATAVMNLVDVLNNTLCDYAKAQDHHETRKHYQIADTLDIEGLKVVIQSPENFSLENEQYLIDLRKKAVDAQSPYDVIQSIDKRIIMRQFGGDIVFERVTMALEQHRPFKHLPSDQATDLVMGFKNDSRDKAFVLYYDLIREDIRQESPNFYELDYNEQKEALDQVIEPYMQRLQGNMQTINVRDILANGNTINEDPEGEGETTEGTDTPSGATAEE